MRKTVVAQVVSLRKRANLSLDELARRMGYRQASSIQRYESQDGVKGDFLPAQIARKMAAALSGLGNPPITDREVLKLAGPVFADKSDRAIPVISYVQAGQWTSTSDPYPPGEGFAEIIADQTAGPRAFALEILGPSMLNRFQQGDRIIIDPDVSPSPGDCVVAKLDAEDEATFKQYRPRGVDAKKRQIIELKPLNETWPPIVLDAQNPGRIIGVMVEHHSYRRSQ